MSQSLVQFRDARTSEVFARSLGVPRADATAEEWVGDDTNYFRYYTGTSTAHQLKWVVLPNAYAAFVATYGDPDDPCNSNAGDGPSDPLANYTCFYYEYNADGRVTKKEDERWQQPFLTQRSIRTTAAWVITCPE